MKKFVFLFFYFLMVLNIHSQTNWSSFVAYHARNINDVFINDYNNICLVGGNKFNDSICSIFLSKDAGQTWQYIMDNISPWAKSITFTSSLNGYIVGDHGKILKTTDGGEHWAPAVFDGRSDRAINALWSSGGPIFLAGADDGLWRSLDGGIRWVKLAGSPEAVLSVVRHPHQNRLLITTADQET